MSTQLATIEQFYEYRGELLPELDAAQVAALNALLKQASDRIRYVTRGAVYARRTDGMAKNGTVRDELARATAAQASFWRGTGDQDGSGAVSGFDAVSMDGVSYSTRGSVAGQSERAAAGRAAPGVTEILAPLPIWTTRLRRF